MHLDNFIFQFQKGDKIGVLAPSSPITEESLETINNSILLMESMHCIKELIEFT